MPLFIMLLLCCYYAAIMLLLCCYCVALTRLDSAESMSISPCKARRRSRFAQKSRLLLINGLLPPAGRLQWRCGCHQRAAADVRRHGDADRGAAGVQGGRPRGPLARGACARAGGQARSSRGRAEIWPRSSRDLPEGEARLGRGVASRCSPACSPSPTLLLPFSDPSPTLLLGSGLSESQRCAPGPSRRCSRST